MAKIDLKLGKDLKKYGAIDFNACYNCGTCTAVCSLSTEDDSFPREMVRCSVLGFESDIKNSLKPWLCYYCGECTTHCPQEAKPGELMMSLRRFLTAKYDWTGLSGLLYKNLSAYIVAFLVITVAIFGIYFTQMFNQQEIMHLGHYFEMFAIGGVFAIILLPNIFRMWLFTVNSKKNKFSLKIYFNSLKELITHMFTQKRTLSCEVSATNKNWWLKHLILVSSYLLLLFTTVFLNWFASQNIVIIAAGYVFSIAIFIITFDFVINRAQKKLEKTTFSHPTDWFFVIWLFLMGISAFFVRLFIDLGLLENLFWVFLIHITVLVQWAIIIVPFGKWTHFLYRSFAMYFDKINKTS